MVKQRPPQPQPRVPVMIWLTLFVAAIWLLLLGVLFR